MAQKKIRKQSHDLDINVEEIYEKIDKNSLLNYTIKQPFTLNEKHTELLHLMQTNKTKMVMVDGPAGSAKTYLAVLAALHLLKEKYIDQIVYIRSIVESASRPMGSLPGEVVDKFLPWTMPLIEKITELTNKTVANDLLKHEMIKGMPVNFCRGLSFTKTFVIVDEFQNNNLSEITTILTRFGYKSKYVLIGDSRQSDIGKNTCIHKIMNCFDTPESLEKDIHCVKFTEDEIVRSEMLKHIVKVLDSIPQAVKPTIPVEYYKSQHTDSWSPGQMRSDS